MCEDHRLLWFLLAAVPAFASGAGLTDTGQTTCYTDSAADVVPASDPASVARDAGTFPRQDCRYGRDPAVVSGNVLKTGAGAQSFDYSKIANNGSVVPLNAALGTALTDWACTRDNVTGLIWEVKTAITNSLRYGQHTYAWLNNDSATNGGSAGSAGIDSCNGTLPNSHCNTEAYVAAVNVANLCGHADWRLPLVTELTTFFNALNTPPEGVDTAFFPNTFGSQIWSASSQAFDTTFAWEANPNSSSVSPKTNAVYVQLVRGPAVSQGADACAAGHPVASIPMTTPTSAFTDNGDGTVTHTPTQLMWKKCAQGLSGTGCTTGAATTVNWGAALAASVADTTAGHNDWRLPNEKELESIVEFCGQTPAINQTIFPNTPSFIFLSSTTYSTGASLDYTVNFSAGNRTPNFKSTTGNVRLVRGGQQPFGAFDAQNAPAPPAILDIDASNTATKYDPLTDGLLVMRYMLGVTGVPLTHGVLGGTATRVDPAAIKTYLDPLAVATLDVDGNGSIDATTDGLLLLRYLFGLRGNSLIAGAVGTGATRVTAQDIESYIKLLMP